MEALKERILRDGRIYPGNILKVDSFLNHMIDVGFLCEVGREFRRIFADCGVTKILTVEASGIGIACLSAQYFGVPVLFAKKAQTKNLSADVYSAQVESYTHGRIYDVFVSKEYLSPDDRVLIIDDFLAKGNALLGLTSLVYAAGAEVVGAGIVIEKGYQGGGDMLREGGLRVESLAVVESMNDRTGEIVFREDGQP